MLMLRSRIAFAGLALALALPAVRVDAQERVVVGKAVSVGRSEAALQLDFQDGGRLEIALREGSVLVDGKTVGSYESGDDLDAAFRSLTAMAVPLDDGALSKMLRDWAPPETLRGDALALAGRIDQTLEAALAGPTAQVDAAEGTGVSVQIGTGSESRMLRLLLGQLGRLDQLQEALGDLSDGDVALHIQEDLDVAAGETVEGSVVVIQSDLRVAGTVRGSVVVVDGVLDMVDGGVIDGDVRLVDARIDGSREGIAGSVIDVIQDVASTPESRRIRDEVRDEIRREIRSEIRHAGRDEDNRSMFSPFRSTARAVGGVMESLLLVLVLGALGVGVTAFAGTNLDVVAETARRAPGRAAVVGLAGSFLLIPVWVLGTVALAVSIVGIPVVIAWVPLFPVAALAAGLLGFLAVSRNVGEWLADSDFRYTDWIRRSNPVYTIFGGLLGLMALFIAADLLRVVPFVGLIRGLMNVVGFITIMVVVQIGFGAVLLTRAGRRREYAAMDPDEAWRQAVNIDIDDDAMSGGPATEGTTDA